MALPEPQEQLALSHRPTRRTNGSSSHVPAHPGPLYLRTQFPEQRQVQKENSFIRSASRSPAHQRKEVLKAGIKAAVQPPKAKARARATDTRLNVVSRTAVRQKARGPSVSQRASLERPVDRPVTAKARRPGWNDDLKTPGLFDPKTKKNELLRADGRQVPARKGTRARVAATMGQQSLGDIPRHNGSRQAVRDSMKSYGNESILSLRGEESEETKSLDGRPSEVRAGEAMDDQKMEQDVAQVEETASDEDSEDEGCSESQTQLLWRVFHSYDTQDVGLVPATLLPAMLKEVGLTASRYQMDAFVSLLSGKTEGVVNIDEWIGFAVAVSLSPASMDDDSEPEAEDPELYHFRGPADGPAGSEPLHDKSQEAFTSTFISALRTEFDSFLDRFSRELHAAHRDDGKRQGLGGPSQMPGRHHVPAQTAPLSHENVKRVISQQEPLVDLLLDDLLKEIALRLTAEELSTGPEPADDALHAEKVANLQTALSKLSELEDNLRTKWLQDPLGERARADGQLCPDSAESKSLSSISAPSLKLCFPPGLPFRLAEQREAFSRHRRYVEAALEGSFLEQWQIIEMLSDEISAELLEDGAMEVEQTLAEFAESIVRTL